MPFRWKSSAEREASDLHLEPRVDGTVVRMRVDGILQDLAAASDAPSSAGCSECDNTGYRGRVGVFELLLIDGAVRDALRTETPMDEIRKMLPGLGFRSMQQDALDKTLRGQTSLDEVLRAFPALIHEPREPLVRAVRATQ